MSRAFVAALATGICLLTATTGSAQPTREGRLLITVVDQSNAIVPAASVTVTGLEDATRKAVPAVETSPSGIATIPGLAPGRYSVQAEFAGFAPGQLKDVRVRPGDNRHIIVLAIEKVRESVDVGQDAQAAAADRRSSSFGTTLTREQMDALSDDPDEMQRQLQDMAGPGAVIRIDSFEGGSLPPRAMIRAIHIVRDQFAAEVHGGDGVFIDIITQPGVGPVRTTMSYNGHNSSMAARNALSPIRASDTAQNYFLNLSGGLIKDKASFALAVRGNSSFESPILTAVLPVGMQRLALGLKSPRDSVGFNGNFDYAITRDQTVRLSYNQNDIANKNQGVGGFNLPEHASTNENHTHIFRMQEAGPLGRRFFTNTRLNVGWTNTSSRSAIEATTIRVLDYFTSGGAQVAGGRHSKDANLGSDLDYVRGMHSVRVGTQLDANWFHSNDTSNYLGTYTFEDLDAYLAGTPRSFTKRVGDPTVNYFNLQAAVYVQDDVRLRKSLTITPGVRYETQTHVNDRGNLGPRFGITWAPFKNGKTTLRTSWGIFYDWLTTNTYEQTLRVDGFKQQELQILNPPYPDPSSSVSSITPVNRYLLDPNLQNARNSRVSAGIDYAFTPRLRAAATYRYIRGVGVLRGENLNAPLNGVRQDPRFGNVIEVVSDGRSLQHVLQLTAQTPPPPPPAGLGPLWDWKRWGVFSSYTLGRFRNNTDGPFSIPATGNPATEWGPTPGSATSRVNAGFNANFLRNFSVGLNGQGFTGTPYNIQTGVDDNGDLIFNDRPAGFGRNTGRTASQWWLNLFMGYSFTFGPRVVLPGGPLVFGTPQGVSVTSFTAREQGRYRMSFNVFVYNLTNRTELTGYSGVTTSPLFGKPTSATNQRRVNIGMDFGF